MKIAAVIAEDDPLFGQFLHSVLTDQPDVDVVLALADGTRVVEEVLRREPHVLLLNLHLPGCDGFDVVDRLREAESPCHVVFVTREEDEQLAVECARRGARGFLPKPEALILLPKAIRAVVNGEPWFSRRVLGIILGEYSALAGKTSGAATHHAGRG